MKILLMIVMTAWMAVLSLDTTAQSNPLPPASAAGQPNIRREPDQCQPWFEQLWQQASQFPQQRPAAVADGLLANLPQRCHANPWVAWLLSRLSPQGNAIKASTPLHPFLNDVEQLQLAAEWIDQGRSQDAIPLLQALARRQPEWAEIAYNLGIAYARQGDRQAARQAWHQAINMCEGRPCRFSASAVAALLATAGRE